MITAQGYSKDKGLMPDGVVITFGREMMNEQGGAHNFLQNFIWNMGNDDGLWFHKCSNWPTIEVCDIYIIVLNRLWARVKFVQYSTGELLCYDALGNEKTVEWKRMELTGPLTRCPFRRTLKGFQGFRYCTKLF